MDSPASVETISELEHPLVVDRVNETGSMRHGGGRGTVHLTELVKGQLGTPEQLAMVPMTNTARRGLVSAKKKQNESVS